MQFIGNRYEILDYSDDIEVGRRYKARDTYYNNTVYIKLINRVGKLSGDFRPDLIDEFTVLNQINCSQIGKIFHTDVHCTEYDVYYYIVSEYFDGQTLKEFIYNNNLNKSAIVNIAIQIAKALETANLNDLYHGSLNPNNILIDKNENIKIYNFGITKANKGINLRLNDDITYLCPHQLNINFTDIESDFFSFGIILFEMVFRELPFGYAYNEKEMLRLVDKGVKWSLLIYDESFTQIIKIIRTLVDRKVKYNATSQILIDLSCIMYEEADIEKNDSIDEYEEIEFSEGHVNLKRKLAISTLVGLLIVIIVIGYL